MVGRLLSFFGSPIFRGYVSFREGKYQVYRGLEDEFFEFPFPGGDFVRFCYMHVNHPECNIFGEHTYTLGFQTPKREEV